MSGLIEGIKLDSGKNRMDLIPVYPLWQLGKVYTFGAGKYEDNNWRKGIKFTRIFSAVMRHLWKFWWGEKVDEESNLPHLAHAAWGCFTLLEYSQNRSEFDDRPEGTVKYEEEDQTQKEADSYRQVFTHTATQHLNSMWYNTK